MLFFFKTLVEWRKFIITTTVLTTVIVAAVSLVLPKWYAASTSVFPPEQRGGSPLYAELLQNLQMPILGPMGTGIRPETIYIDMLKSRHVARQLIDEFDLSRVYKVSRFEDAHQKLQSRTGLTLLENGLLIVTFEDRDPQLAADIANRYVELLDHFNRELSITRASKTREFIEGQLDERRIKLSESESQLKTFQDTNKALELEEQLRSAMTIITDLTAQAIALETELHILEYYTSPSSDEYVQKKREYEEVVSQLEKLKIHDRQEDEDLLRAYIPALDEIPELALQMLRLRRNVEIETVVYTMLLKEYEKSRIEEARDTPTLQVMDIATVPDLRSRPRRKAMVVVGALVGLAWSVFLALLITAWRENRSRSRVIKEVFDPLISDFSRVFRRR